MRNDIASRAAFAFTPSSLRSFALGLIAALIVSLAAPAAFARDDDSYKGPSTGGGLDDQLREMEPQAPPPAASPGLRSRDAAPAAAGGGGLRGRVTEGTIAPIPIAIPVFLGRRSRTRGRYRRRGRSRSSDARGFFGRSTAQSFLEQVRDVNAAPRFPDWRSIHADALVVGPSSMAATARSALSSGCGMWLAASSSRGSDSRPARPTGAASATSSPTASMSG